MCQKDLIDSDNHSRCCKHRPSGSQESPIQTVLGFLVGAGCWSPGGVGGSTQAELTPGARRRLAAPWYPSPAGDGQTHSIPPGGRSRNVTGIWERTGISHPTFLLTSGVASRGPKSSSLKLGLRHRFVSPSNCAVLCAAKQTAQGTAAIFNPGQTMAIGQIPRKNKHLMLLLLCHSCNPLQTEEKWRNPSREDPGNEERAQLGCCFHP